MEYLPHSHDHSFTALAERYNAKGGKRIVQRWYDRWDGTVQSQQHQPKAGRPRLLSAAQIRDTIALPIRNRNRSHHAVHYTELLPTVRDKTGTTVSLPTVQRYGKEIVRARDKSTRSRTAAESKCKQICIWFYSLPI